jgi:hypothetical protein
MSKLIFVVLLNMANGQQIEAYRSEPMTFVECDKRQREVWAGDWPVAFIDEEGAAPVIDAACVPE